MNTSLQVNNRFTGSAGEAVRQRRPPVHPADTQVDESTHETVDVQVPGAALLSNTLFFDGEKTT